MVKTKGFTLIEIMVVIAIMGILFSMVIGPMKDNYNSNHDTGWNGDMSGSTTDTDADMIINGIPYTCDAAGDCEPVE